RLRAPAAPLGAAANEGRHLDPAALVAGYHRLARDHAIVLAEGAGGLAVPLAPGWDTARLAAACGLPLLVVARSTLGTLNHCALTVAYARLRRLPVLAICLNRFDATGELAETTAPTVLAHWLGLPVVTFPSLPGLDVDAGPTDEILAALAAQAEATFDIDALVAQIREVTP
ncbi:MAG: dethiobiotin synthase, partial [Clostridia bacterium]|nr:dethiobiotin synthase [Clostridia bacterium]